MLYYRYYLEREKKNQFMIQLLIVRFIIFNIFLLLFRFVFILFYFFVFCLICGLCVLFSLFLIFHSDLKIVWTWNCFESSVFVTKVAAAAWADWVVCFVWLGWLKEATTKTRHKNSQRTHTHILYCVQCILNYDLWFPLDASQQFILPSHLLTHHNHQPPPLIHNHTYIF